MSRGTRRSSRPGGLPRRHRDEAGAALLLAIVSIALITAVAVAVVVSTATDTLISGSYRTSQEGLYAAEAGVERAMAELAGTPDWSPVLAAAPGNLSASFSDTTAAAKAPDGRTLSMPALTAARQAASNAVFGPAVFGADSPSWRLYAHASLHDLVPPALVAPPSYVVVFAADDGADADGDPTKDSNGRLLLYAEAYGVAGARRAIQVAVARVLPGQIRVVAWNDVH